MALGEEAAMGGYDDEAERLGSLRLAPFWRSWRGRLLLAIVAASGSVPSLIKMVM